MTTTKKTAAKSRTSKAAPVVAAPAPTAKTSLALRPDQLTASSVNQRRRYTETSLETMAHSLGRHQLHPLKVRPAMGEEGPLLDRWDVVAGSRRWRSAAYGIEHGILPAHFTLDCDVVADDVDARALSLDENAHRENLSPVEEFRAFADMIAAGHSIEDVAARYGVTVTVVKERMTLARISPAILAHYEEGRLTLDQLKAFASTTDHERQEQVHAKLFAEGAPSWQRNAQDIRRAVRLNTVSMKSELAQFVGLEEYEARGGAVARDLFSDDGGTITDVGLLEKMAVEKLEAAAEQLKAEGWGWVKVFTDPAEQSLYYRQPGNRRAHTAAEKTDLERIETELEALYEADGEAFDDERYELLLADQDALKNLPEEYAADVLPTLGAGVMRSGADIEIKRGLILRSEKPAPVIEEDEDEPEVPAPVSPKPATGTDISNTLAERLSRRRTAAMRAEMLSRPDVALIALLAQLAPDALGYTYKDDLAKGKPAMSMTMTLHSAVKDEACAADTAFSGTIQLWRAKIEAGQGSFWQRVEALTEAERMELLTVVAAAGVFEVAFSAHGTLRANAGDMIADALDLDMSKHWQANEEYFKKLTQAQIAAAVLDATKDEGKAQLVANVSKKKDTAKMAVDLVAGTGWIPVELRRLADRQPAEAEAETPDAGQIEEEGDEGETFDPEEYAAA